MKKSLPWFKKLKPNWVKLVLVVFLITVCCLLMTNLGRDPLFDWDEGIYGQLGAELLESGKLFVTSWNYSPWFEKPPGIAWLSALGQLIAGHSAYGVRFLMPLVSMLTLYMLYKLGSTLKNWRVGLMAAGLLTTFNLFLGRARGINTDMPLLLGIITTFYFLLTDRKSWQVALVVALSIWFKGLAGLLPLLIVFPLIFAKGKKYSLSFAIWSLLFIMPWHLYSYLKYGMEFVRPYLLEQVIRRATVPIEFHLESRWFYFQYLYTNLGLGTIIVLSLAILQLFYQALTARSIKLFTLLWWLLFPLALFTLAKTRLFWYILPVYPAIALIISYLLESFAFNGQSRKVLTILTLGILLQGLASTARSVELARVSSPLSDRLIVATRLRGQADSLAVLVPPSERMAEAILPKEQTISSSFRYGGMPSVVFYYQGPVKFFYNVDEFNAYWQDKSEPLAMISTHDQDLISSYHIVTSTQDYLGISKESQ